MIRLMHEGASLVRHRNQLWKRSAKAQRAAEVPPDSSDEDELNFITSILPSGSSPNAGGSLATDCRTEPEGSTNDADMGSDATITLGDDTERLEDFAEEAGGTVAGGAAGESDAPLTDIPELAEGDTAIEPDNSTRREQPPRACKGRQSYREFFSWR